jgi:hypothetical protein
MSAPTRRSAWAGTIVEAGVTKPLLVCAAAIGIGSLLGGLRATWLLMQAEDVDVTDDGGSLPGLLYGRWAS